MTAKTDYLEQKLLDHTLNAVAFTSPSTWAALYTAAPGETGGGTEVTGGSYARQRIFANGGGSPDWNLAVSEGGGGFVVDNSDDVVFPVATADWGTVTHTAILDAVTLGNMLYYGALTASKTVNTNDTFKFLAGALDIIEK